MSSDEAPRWGCPKAWQAHVLITHPSGGASGSHMRRHAQIHSMRRDEQGRLNDLDGGRPRMLEGFLDDLQAGIEAEGIAGRRAPAGFGALVRRRPGVERIDPHAIEAAIQALRADGKQAEHLARLYEVLRYFQSPAPLRRFDAEGFAAQLLPPTDKSGLYRLKRWACYAVWERLPLAERLKAGE